MHFQFIHTADLHLGAPFVGLHQSNSQIAMAADRATYGAFEKIIDAAIARKVLFVLFSGDIYDAEFPHLKAQLTFRDGIRRLHDAGIQSVVIRGNHDHGGSTRAQLEFPDSYYEFSPGAGEPHYICQNETPLAVVYGYSYPKRAVTENILRHYKPQAEDEKYFRIGMLHGNVGGDEEHDNYAPCSVAQLKEIDIHYWALGHVHQQKVLSAQTPIIAYPGTPQGLSPRETGTHGCFIIEVKDNRVYQQEFIPTDSLRWRSLSCEIDGLNGEEELLRAMELQVNQAAEQEQCTLIARMDLTGRGTLHRSLQNPQTLGDLREEMNARNDAVWLDRVQNLTRPDIDLHQKRQENNLLGDFLRLCQNAEQEDALQEKVLLELREVCDHSVVRDALGMHGTARQQAWLESCLPEWLEQAEIHGADLLLGEDAS